MTNGSAAVGATRTQNFHAPVGTVATADTIHIHTSLGIATTGPTPERASLAPTLIDRRPQSELVTDRLLDMEAAGPSTLLVIVPGCIPDLHHAFVLRCARIDFLSDQESVWRYLKQLPWPEGASSVDAVLKTIRDGALMPKSHRRPQIEATLRELSSNLCFSHFVDASAWEEDGGALVRAWVDYLCSGALERTNTNRTVAFLCIALREPRTATCGEIERFLEELKRRQEVVACLLVTPLLRPIRHRHLAEWVSEASSFLEDDLVEAELVDLPAALFPDPDDTRPFSVVYEAAQAKLTKAVQKHQPRFVEAQS